ncbi:hypothetical protein [Pedobacter sp. MC2016-24]|uniref:hypothetical protein n=1 Tax=Pedobacter sp. MC2016-24 TaxID=2780090 RepID=UPI00187DE4BE|nr:hypothetical protein [Pedobacter sp. MC2016-24]MBE9600975.1 hypothetical protein [Pedobacter sp. MC2016-24]
MIKLKLLLLLSFTIAICKGQPLVSAPPRNLDKRVTLNIRQEPVSAVLDKMSKAGDFYFSYSGSLFKQDSIVNIDVKSAYVRDILDQLFNGKVDYKETGEYIILRYAANHLTIEPENITSAEQLYLISGYITDLKTGKRVKQASVYEKRLLQSTLTDDNGYFKLRFKGNHSEVILTASKDTYRDTTLVFLSDITVKPGSYKGADDEVNPYNAIGSSGIGRFFISSKQRLQNLNIPNFFAYSPFQASFTPGLSSHGMMSSQVVNKVSLNVLGGYTAGSNGFEMAGLFNINKGDMSKLQFAGLFNLVGGSVKGFQVAGLHNEVQGEQTGMQAAGLINHNRKNSTGFEMAGLMNVTHGKSLGMQAAGLINLVGKSTNGAQLAGLGNITARELKGIQIAGLFNYAKNMNGVQIGLINLSDSSSGYSIGLINLVKHGYHQLSLSTNSITNVNVGYKTGNAKLYSMMYIGTNISDTAKVSSLGLGLGHDFIISKRISIAAELSFHYLYLGNFDFGNTLNKLQTNLQVQLFKGIGVFAGPTYYYYNTDAPPGSSAKHYKQQVYPNKHHSFSGNNKGWLGFNAGITIM